MGLYNFQKRFVPMIEAGTKTHTIRAPRRHPDEPGRMLHLYTGLRQRGARLLKRVACVAVQEICIKKNSEVLIDGVKLSTDECEALARSDGFGSFQEMMRFWDGRRPFVGQVIHWGGE
jgi:type IV secretory pathway protease TraF